MSEFPSAITGSEFTGDLFLPRFEPLLAEPSLPLGDAEVGGALLFEFVSAVVVSKVTVTVAVRVLETTAPVSSSVAVGVGVGVCVAAFGVGVGAGEDSLATAALA